MRAEIKVSQKDVKATVRASQEKMEAAICSIRSEMEETMKYRVEDVHRPTNTGPPRGTQWEYRRNTAGFTSGNERRSRGARPQDPLDSNQHTSNEDPRRNHAVWTRDQPGSSRSPS
jgi:hypothetical protein